MSSAPSKKKKFSSRGKDDLQRLALIEQALIVMQGAERDPRQTLRMLYGVISVFAMRTDQLQDFVERAKARTLWTDPRLDHLTTTFNFKR